MEALSAPPASRGVRLLRRLGYVTHVIELPGTSCGPALRREHATFAQLAAQTARVVDTIGIRRALVLGHSLGGGIALHLALSRRELIDRLVLIAPAGLDAEVHVLAGAGHMLTLEAPAWTNRHVARFVASLRPALREAA